MFENKVKEFIPKYEKALFSQNWENVAPLFYKDAHVIFSDGSTYHGIDKIKTAFERNFSIIKNEKYKIDNVKWLTIEDNFAMYVFDFNWTGIINGERMSGGGVGSTVIIFEDDDWKILSEHLGKKA